MWATTKNHNIDVGVLKRPIPNITPIFGISQLNPADTNNGFFVSAGMPTISGIGYCYQPIPIINPRCYDKSFF
jgi:hypothetical protein